METIKPEKAIYIKSFLLRVVKLFKHAQVTYHINLDSLVAHHPRQFTPSHVLLATTHVQYSTIKNAELLRIVKKASWGQPLISRHSFIRFGELLRMYGLQGLHIPGKYCRITVIQNRSNLLHKVDITTHGHIHTYTYYTSQLASEGLDKDCWPPYGLEKLIQQIAVK